MVVLDKLCCCNEVDVGVLVWWCGCGVVSEVVLV